MCVCKCILNTSSTRTGRGGSCLRDIYIRLFFSVELACAVRQPSPCMRALCESGVLFHMSHLKLHFALHTSHCSLHTPHYTLHTPHFTLHSSHSTLHFALHSYDSTLHTPHFSLLFSHSALHTSHFTLHSPHFTLLIAFFTLHTSHFTLHTSNCTLHAPHVTPHFISSELFSPYPSSSLLMSSLLICHLSFHESLPSTTTKELACAVRQPGPCVCALCGAAAVLLSKNMTYAQPRCNATSIKHFPHTSHCILHTSHSTLALHFNSSHLSSSHIIVSCLPICQLQ